MQWEYKVVELDTKAKSFINNQPDLLPFEAMLNEMGRNRWELVTCKLPSATGIIKAVGSAVFKRPK